MSRMRFPESLFVGKSAVWAALVLLLPLAANADDCQYIQLLRMYASNKFAAIKTIPQSREDIFHTSWILPDAGECEIKLSDLSSAEYSCSWYIARDVDGPASVKNSFDKMVPSLIGCVAPPPKYELKKSRRGGGEELILTDLVNGESEKAFREIWLQYHQHSHWWVLRLHYSISWDN